MVYEIYNEKRTALVNEARQAIEEGNMDLYNEKIQEINDLDARFDSEAEAEANLSALEDNKRIQNIAAPGSKPGDVVDTTKKDNGFQNPMTAEAAYATDTYTNAWGKHLRGEQMTAEEQSAFTLVNVALSTSNTSVVIPKHVVDKIWEEAAELYPYWNDVEKTYIKGIFEMEQENASSAAAWYDEATPTADGSETFKSYTLTGCELARKIPVKWKLKEMSLQDFIPYVTRKMSQQMGAALGYGATHGKGKPGSGETFKPEPLGTVTKLVADNENIVTYTAGALAYTEITKAIGNIGSAYKPGAAVYCNNYTTWNELANVCDDNGRPIFVPDPTGQGAYRIFGMVVKEDASMANGEILFSNPRRGYQANVNKEMTVTPAEDHDNRQTNYHSYAIVDGAPTTNKAHSLLKYNA